MYSFPEEKPMNSAFNIAVSGLNDAVTRIANAASNIVNASSTGRLPDNAGQNYSGFQPQDIVTLSQNANGQGLGVTSTSTPRNPGYVVTSDPTSALANAQGLVGAPNVDLASELVTANVAKTNYTANAAVIRIQEKTEKALLDIKT
jgi:flagellar basal-body rod protein FlgC